MIVNKASSVTLIISSQAPDISRLHSSELYNHNCCDQFYRKSTASRACGQQRTGTEREHSFLSLCPISRHHSYQFRLFFYFIFYFFKVPTGYNLSFTTHPGAGRRFKGVGGGGGGGRDMPMQRCYKSFSSLVHVFTQILSVCKMTTAFDYLLRKMSAPFITQKLVHAAVTVLDVSNAQSLNVC